MASRHNLHGQTREGRITPLDGNDKPHTTSKEKIDWNKELQRALRDISTENGGAGFGRQKGYPGREK
jgi:hypothetical protein